MTCACVGKNDRRVICAYSSPSLSYELRTTQHRFLVARNMNAPYEYGVRSPGAHSFLPKPFFGSLPGTPCKIPNSCVNASPPKDMYPPAWNVLTSRVKTPRAATSTTTQAKKQKTSSENQAITHTSWRRIHSRTHDGLSVTFSKTRPRTKTLNEHPGGRRHTPRTTPIAMPHTNAHTRPVDYYTTLPTP